MNREEKRHFDEINPAAQTPRWQSVSEIPGFPFETFDQMQAAVAARSFNIGVDSYAAAEWSNKYNKALNKILIAALSILLVLAAVAAVAAAFALPDYWLLAALPAQALSFYVSHPASPFRKWATVAGAASVAVFINLLFNGQPTAATVVAYAGLTFAAVRAAGFISNSGFRKALLADEDMFLTAYENRLCTVRNNQTERVYWAK
jgi:hypothetical protein